MNTRNSVEGVISRRRCFNDENSYTCNQAGVTSGNTTAWRHLISWRASKTGGRYGDKRGEGRHRAQPVATPRAFRASASISRLTAPGAGRATYGGPQEAIPSHSPLPPLSDAITLYRMTGTTPLYHLRTAHTTHTHHTPRTHCTHCIRISHYLPLQATLACYPGLLSGNMV